MEKDREAFEAALKKYETLMDQMGYHSDREDFQAGWQAALAYAREERVESAESRADAFFDRVLSTPEAQMVLERGDENRPGADLIEESAPTQTLPPREKWRWRLMAKTRNGDVFIRELNADEMEAFCAVNTPFTPYPPEQD